jgi:hypothetical protein
MMWTAFRLASIVGNGSSEVMYLTRGSLNFRISGVWYTNPTRAQLAAMQPGDVIAVAPDRTKSDRFGEVHCSFPAFLTYSSEVGNAASALRDIELRSPCFGDALRKSTPLFADECGRPYSHAVLDALLKAVLTHCFGAGVASVYSFHSFRSGLACALYASGCPDPMIQLLCRWMNPASLRLYRRMTPGQCEELIRSASTADVASIQTANIPRVSGDQSFATINGWECPPSDLLRLFNAAQSGTDADGNGPPARKTANRATPASPRQARKPSASRDVATPGTPRTPVKPRHDPKSVTAEAPAGCAWTVGARVAVDRTAYPDESCNEHGGLAYEGTITGFTSSTAKITFKKISRRTNTNYRGDVPLSLLRAIP